MIRILAIMVTFLCTDLSLYAQDNKKAKKESKGRQKVLSSEGRSRAGQKTQIDFDETGIDGQRRTPAGMAITKKNPDNQYDLINLRLRWHPEMIQSTTNLETGRSK